MLYSINISGLTRWRFPEFIYRVPVPASPSYSLEGLSLEEIEKKFGRERALLRYFLASHGFPVKEPIDIDLKTKEMVDIEIRSHEDGNTLTTTVKVYLVPNRYTRAQKERQLFVVTLPTDINSNVLREMLTEGLWYWGIKR